MNQQVDRSLADVRLLRSLGDDELKSLEQRCRWRWFKSGTQIIGPDSDAENDFAAHDIMFIVEGRVRVVQHTIKGREIAFAVVEMGGHIGELSAIDGRARSASVIALDETFVALLSPDRFNDLLLRSPSVAVELLHHLAAIVRTTDERIAELSTLSSMQRVYRELARMAEDDPVAPMRKLIRKLPTQQEIASRSGVTRETVARALGQLGDRGLVKRKGRLLLINDPQGLEDLGSQAEL
ncbi:MAG: Crp/Fnr family transcriptional regulator [Geminicoccaceae bacterium]